MQVRGVLFKEGVEREQVCEWGHFDRGLFVLLDLLLCGWLLWEVYQQWHYLSFF